MADYREYFEDVFSVDIKGGELDLSESQTTWLDEQDLSRDDRNEYETRFIDEIYGTENALESTYMKMNEVGAIGSKWGASGAAKATWGLDLRRTERPPNVSHYEWLTKGKVDWASYEEDSYFKKVYREMKGDKDFEGLSWLDDTVSIEFLTNVSNEGPTDQMKADFVRAAESYSIPKGSDEMDDPNSWWNKWDNKHVTTFDPSTAEPYTKTYLDVPDITDQLRKDIAAPSDVSKPNINIKTIQVERPSNLPPGKVASRPTTNY